MKKSLTKSQFDTLIQALKKAGKLTASGVLEMANNPKSPLYRLFEWDDDKAAKQYRLMQARQVIKLVNVKIDKPEDRIVHIPAIRGEGEYKTMGDVVTNISEFELALSEALKRLKASEKAVSDLQQVAQTESPDKVAFLAVALKGLETAESALNKLH